MRAWAALANIRGICLPALAHGAPGPRADNHLLAYELLKKAEILTSPSGYITDKRMRMKLRAVTFNNFGCFYKRRGKLHAALQYLAKALKIELTSEEVDNPAGTHLNLCATLSQLAKKSLKSLYMVRLYKII